MEYTCKHCGKCFDKPGTLKRHKAIHSGRKPYMCSHCGKTFNDPSSCRRHVRTQHKEKKAGFNQVRNLQQHKNMHAERKCNKQQPDISQEKKREVRQRGPSQPLKPVRSKTANRKKGIAKGHSKGHSKDLHSSGPRTKHQLYKCEKCNRSFCSAYSLGRHTIIHSNKRPYKCKYCGRSFNDSGNRLKHERLHARKANLSVNESCTTQASTVQRCDAIESESCWVCQKSFSREALQDHYEKCTCILELLFNNVEHDTGTTNCSCQPKRSFYTFELQ